MNAGQIFCSAFFLVPNSMKPFFSFGLIVLLCACGNSGRVDSKANHSINFLHDIPAFTSDSFVNVVIEIPAGTCLKTEYDKSTNKFAIERLSDGTLRRVQFLPYPGNYGFIPSTEISRDLGGDGDALDVLVLAEALPQGEVIATIPIALLKMIDNNELDYKIIAVPKDPKLQVINCTTFACLQQNYPAVVSIVELWFTHYKGNKRVLISGWDAENSAIQEIKKWNK
jgi:inorganic pyrophosphatase